MIAWTRRKTRRCSGPSTGEEASPTEFNVWLRARLTTYGLERFAKGGHCIRIGAATTVSALKGL